MSRFNLKLISHPLCIWLQALYAALQKLDEGGSIDDAKAVCGPGLLRQLTQWEVNVLLKYWYHKFSILLDFFFNFERE